MENGTFSKDELIQSWDWSTAACKKKNNNAWIKQQRMPLTFQSPRRPYTILSRERASFCVLFLLFRITVLSPNGSLKSLPETECVGTYRQTRKRGKKNDARGQVVEMDFHCLCASAHFWLIISPSEWGRNVLEVINPRNIASLESNLESAMLTMWDLQLLTVGKTPQEELKCAAINKWRKRTQNLTFGKEAMILILVSLIPGEPTFPVYALLRNSGWAEPHFLPTLPPGTPLFCFSVSDFTFFD